MSACERYEAEICALLDGELDAAAEEALRAHMETCESCRMLYETFSLLHEDAQEPPADLTARIMDAVREEKKPGKVTQMPKRKNRWIPWLAAAACLFLIVGAVALPRMTASNTAAGLNAATRSVPAAEQAEAADQSANTLTQTAGDTETAAPEASPDSTDDSVAMSASPMALTDPEQIGTVRAMLASPTETEMPGEEDAPILMLSDAGAWAAIWIDGDDLVYTENGTQYYRCENAAETLIEYLSEL